MFTEQKSILLIQDGLVNITVKVRKDATAGDVITKGLKAKGYEAEVNAEYNYITAITTQQVQTCSI